MIIRNNKHESRNKNKDKNNYTNKIKDDTKRKVQQN